MARKDAVGVRIGVDVGGTFTDAALEIGDKRFVAKVLTTHGQPDDGVLAAITSVLDAADVELSSVASLIHGTTLATNALIERRGARVAMLTTEGFRDVVEIGHEHRFDLFDINIVKQKPLVPRDRRIPVAGRIGSKGQILREMDDASVQSALEAIGSDQIDAVAICLINSYANDSHEKELGNAVREAFPDLLVSISSEVSPELREYERFSTTCANAYVQPLMAGYLGRLEMRLKEKGLARPLLLMSSGGGLCDVQTASEFPIRLVESGPAGGALYASHVAAENGLTNVLSFDMGGTTAKLCAIEEGAPRMARQFEIARAYRFKKGSGLPIKIPVVDMVEIGAGGGSIVSKDKLGRLQVGPRSAGSEPGPICYTRGGTEATVTDANLLLGRIEPGTFSESGENARAEVGRLAMDAVQHDDYTDVVSLAAAVSGVVEENMAAAARVHAVERGITIQGTTVIAFGGAAPLHAASVADKIGAKHFLVPVSAGVGSAVGFLRAPTSFEVSRSVGSPVSVLSPENFDGVLSELSQDAASVVRGTGYEGEVQTEATAAMRYIGQGHEIEVPVQSGSYENLTELFETEYRRRFGRIVEAAGLELLTIYVRASSPVDLPQADDPPDTVRIVEAADTLQAYDQSSGKIEQYAHVNRDDLSPGDCVLGPALIREQETTTVLPSTWEALVLQNGALIGRSRNHAESGR